MYELIEHRKLDTAASSITFSNIPQTFTDLYLVFSLRGTNSSGSVELRLLPNGVGGNDRVLYGFGSGGVGSNAGATLRGVTSAASATTSTFGSGQAYIPNYTVSGAKNISMESLSENMNSVADTYLLSGVSSTTTAITSLTISTASGDFVQNSSATLYGINRTSAIGRPSQPKAIGGNITFVNGYWVHTFTGSGSLIVNKTLVAEYLVVGGGGGSGPSFGGGGAGGYRSSVVGEASGGGAPNESQLTLTAGTSYPVTVGAGAARNATGSSSVLATVTSLGGGYGGTGNGRSAGNGGSGGGGSSSWTDGNSGGSGTAGQGYAGGYASPVYYVDHGGGGGGAGGAGAATSGDNGGNGGVGVQSSITGTAVYRAGGGAGGTVQGSPGSNGLGTGANTGGGGYTASNSGAGHSGVVIIRYRAD